jgi:hypothetical protein
MPPYGALNERSERKDRDRDHRDHRENRDRDRRGREEADSNDREVIDRLGREGVTKLLDQALESLYRDRIKPLANYVRGRLKERSCPPVIVKTFLDLYGQRPERFLVQKPEMGSSARADADDKGNTVTEPTILFAQSPEWFLGWVDIDSPDDPYEESVWDGLKEFLKEGEAFSGGRYGVARELMQRKLPFFAALSLGEVCHLVQLAIQHRKIMVYHRKMLRSADQPLKGNSGTATNGEDGDKGLDDIKDVYQLSKVIFKLQAKHPDLRLDQLKRLMKEDCHSRLNEMTFQCTKLIDIFRKDPLESSFELVNNGKAFTIRARDPSKFSGDVREAYLDVKHSGR